MPTAALPLAATGLGLSDFLIGTAQIIHSGGQIFSTATLNDQEKALFSDLQVSNAALLQLALTPETIRTITYTRGFTITRSVGGGLTFQISDYSLSLTGSGNGRTRDKNLISVKMGGPKTAPKVVSQGSSASAPPFGGAQGGAAEALQESVLERRASQLSILKKLPQNNVLIVTPPSQ